MTNPTAETVARIAAGIASPDTQRMAAIMGVSIVAKPRWKLRAHILAQGKADEQG